MYVIFHLFFLLGQDKKFYNATISGEMTMYTKMSEDALWQAMLMWIIQKLPDMNVLTNVSYNLH